MLDEPEVVLAAFLLLAALLIAAILAPTDAALGLPIYTNPRMPVRIRRALNIESGLNDGIASPFVILFLAMTLAEEEVIFGQWLQEALLELGQTMQPMAMLDTLTVLISVFAHGFSVRPIVNWYSRRLDEAEQEHIELAEIAELPARRRLRVFDDMNHGRQP